MDGGGREICRRMDLQPLEPVAGDGCPQRGDRGRPHLLEFALQCRVAMQLAQHLARQEQALLVEERVALVHRTPLVLLLEDDAAGGGDVGHGLRWVANFRSLG